MDIISHYQILAERVRRALTELWKTTVERTVVGGHVVYDRTFDIVDDLINEETFNPGTHYTSKP